MRVQASSWRPLLAAIVLGLFPLSLAGGAGATDSEQSDAAKDPKIEAEGVERERTPEEREKIERETQVGKLKEMAERIQRQLRELRPEQRDLAEKLERELMEIRERVQQSVGAERFQAERERLTSRLQELKEAMIRAREAGQRDEVGRLEREAQEVMQLLRGGAKRLEEQGEEEMQRLRHLRQAIENLREGGFHDLAERLQREAEERMRGFWHEGRPDASRQPQPFDRPPRPELRDGPPRPELEKAVDELRAEIRRLHHEMEGLRERLNRIAEERRGEKQ